MRIFPVRSPLILAAVLFMLGGVIGPLAAQEATSGGDSGLVYLPDEPIDGATLGEWSARHWQWTVSFPVGINPGHDVTGATCGYGQSGPVFFVPRNFPPCIVPSGVALFVPIAGTECSTAEPPPFYGQREMALRSCAAAEVDRYTGIVVRVDGQRVPDIAAHRASSPRFTMILPQHNVLGVPLGVADAVADGYQVILRPLPAGEHEIVTHVELTDGTILPDKVLRVTVVEPAGRDRGASPVPATPEATPVP